MPLRTEVGLGPGDVVLDGDPTPPKRGTAPNFGPVYCGQTAGWIKMPLGMVCLSPCHIVLDGNPTPPKGAQQPPLFGPCLLWPRSSISATAELLFIRPHRSTTYVDVACCYQRSCMVCQSVGLSATLLSPAKTAATIEMPFGMRTWLGPGNHVLGGGPNPSGRASGL